MSEKVVDAGLVAFYKKRLTDVLSKHNPSGLNTIDSLLKSFPGKEHLVYVQICKKCGVMPMNPPTAAEIEKGVLESTAAEDRKVALWLSENGFQKYASMEQFLKMDWDTFLSISSKGRLIELGVVPKHAQPLLLAIIGMTGKSPSEPIKKADFEVGENCYTKVVATSNQASYIALWGDEKWLNARVTHINDDNTFDIFVYNSLAHGVPQEAVNVPRNMLKKSSEDVQVAIPQKQKNLKRPQFQPGDRIRVFGLRSHTAYNGMNGTVIMYVPSERRYQVRLDTNDVIAIKQRNVAAPLKDFQSVEAANELGKNKPKDDEKVKKSDDAILSDLMIKLMQDNPDTDPAKLGEFAAGYLMAKRKMLQQDS